MKDNIERIFKQQLENYELPYEAGAWEAMSKRLDGTPSTSFYRKWWFAASVGTVLVGSAFFFTRSESQPETKPAVVAAIPSAPKTTETVTTSNSATDTETMPPSTVVAESPSTGRSAEITVTNIPDFKGFQLVPIIQDIINPSSSTSGDGTPDPADLKLNPVVVPASVCQDAPFTIVNPNSIDLYVKLPGSAEQVIPGKKSLLVVPSEAGLITLRSGKMKETVTVNPVASRLYIDVDASVLYENGIPTVKFEVSGSENEVSWESNVASRSIDKNKITVHPFKDKRVEVTATSADQNGCAVSETKTIFMEDSYNLIAMDAFRPMSEIAENRLFMPYALILRDAAFELTIFDTKSGAQVYKTNDPSAGWDGTDKRNGEMVPVSSIWSWKVVMKNPLPGEQAIYSGIVTRL